MSTHAHVVPTVVVCVFLGLGLPVRAGHAELVWFYGSQFDQAIPADPEATRGWMDDATIEVPDHLLIEDLNVTVSLTHTNVFDLQLFLTSPSGTTVLLNAYDPFTEYFEGADYQQTVFDDEADIGIKEATAPFRGWFRPHADTTLSVFDGEDAFGDWRLQIYDAYYVNEGQLDAFGLIVTATPEPATILFLLTGLGLVGFSRRRAG